MLLAKVVLDSLQSLVWFRTFPQTRIGTHGPDINLNWLREPCDADRNNTMHAQQPQSTRVVEMARCKSQRKRARAFKTHPRSSQPPLRTKPTQLPTSLRSRHGPTLPSRYLNGRVEVNLNLLISRLDFWSGYDREIKETNPAHVRGTHAHSLTHSCLLIRSSTQAKPT